jgi:hypothetical protein
MKTNNFFEELIKYFENTPREQVLADWAKSEEFDNVGPAVEDILSFSKRRQKIELTEHRESEYSYNLNNLNPKKASGFLLKSY